jgi:hypothetical protein
MTNLRNAVTATPGTACCMLSLTVINSTAARAYNYGLRNVTGHVT